VLSGLEVVASSASGRALPRAGREIAKRYGVLRFDRFSELLDRCDAVAFPVPPPVQAELAADATGRGKTIFLGRPLAGDIAGAELLAAAVQTHHVISQMGWLAPSRWADSARQRVIESADTEAPLGV
jgi:predicted dehydrogenase